MAKVLIPYKDALKLWQERESFQRAAQMIANAERIQQRAQQRLADLHDFKDIPLDKQIDIKLEDGPDKKGMIAVEWPDEM